MRGQTKFILLHITKPTLNTSSRSLQRKNWLRASSKLAFFVTLSLLSLHILQLRRKFFRRLNTPSSSRYWLPFKIRNTYIFLHPFAKEVLRSILDSYNSLGELNSLLKDDQGLQERFVPFYAAEILLALEYVNDKMGIVYR